MDHSSNPPASRPFTLPTCLPVIVLDGCYHFPGCHLPLFIFEDRYRQMLDHALCADRMFCVGVKNADDILPVVTAGLICSSVKNPDGTSQVMLYGVHRMRIDGWEQTAPFRIARVSPVLTQQSPSGGLEAFKERALQLLPDPTTQSCDRMRQLRQELAMMSEAETVCDIIAFHFVRRKSALRALLQECCPQRRYQVLLAELERGQEG